jgi:hypothetical protein
MVCLNFYMHGRPRARVDIPFNTVYAFGTLFTFAVGKPVPQSIMQNVRFRVGGIVLGAEAQFCALVGDNIDIQVHSVLRGGAVGDSSIQEPEAESEVGILAQDRP